MPASSRVLTPPKLIWVLVLAPTSVLTALNDSGPEIDIVMCIFMITKHMNRKHIIPLVVITVLLTTLYSMANLILNDSSLDRTRPFYMQQY